jgi:hypothetical protein
MPGVFVLNERAADVQVDNAVDLYDVVLLQNYVNFRTLLPGIFVLGLAPSGTN